MPITPDQPDIFAEIFSTLRNGFLIAAVIVGCAALAAAVWKVGCYFGRPLGNMIVRLMPMPEKPREENRTSAQRGVGGVMAMFLCFIACSVESTLFEITRLGPFGQPHWTWQAMVLVFVKGCLEGMIAVGVLGQVVRVLGLE